MIKNIKVLKIISLYLILFIMVSISSIGACYDISLQKESRVFNTKNVGKLSMIAMLSTIGLIVKYLNHKDKETTINIREKFGSPYSILEWQKGFDIMRLEIYKDRIFIFRNEILYKSIELSSSTLEY